MNKRIQVILPEAIAEVIQQKAVQEDRSVSNFARKLILRGIENGKNKPDLQ